MEEQYNTREYLNSLRSTITENTTYDADKIVMCRDIKTLFDLARDQVIETEQAQSLRYKDHLKNSPALLKVLMKFDEVKSYINNSSDINYDALTQVVDRIYKDSFACSDHVQHGEGAGFLASSFSDVTLFALQCYESTEEAEQYSPLHFFKSLLSVQAAGIDRYSNDLYESGVRYEELGV